MCIMWSRLQIFTALRVDLVSCVMITICRMVMQWLWCGVSIASFLPKGVSQKFHVASERKGMITSPLCNEFPFAGNVELPRRPLSPRGPESGLNISHIQCTGLFIFTSGLAHFPWTRPLDSSQLLFVLEERMTYQSVSMFRRKFISFIPDRRAVEVQYILHIHFSDSAVYTTSTLRLEGSIYSLQLPEYESTNS